MTRSWFIAFFILFFSVFATPAFSQDKTEIREKLDSSVVSARTPAITRRGDTLVMNVSRAKTLDYDKLADLLRQYPGVSVNDGKLFINGEQVNKILLNGKMIFGDNVSAPLDLVLAKMVKGIKTWREYDRGRLVEGDTLGAKQRVVDVQTHQPVNNFRVFTISGGGGATTSRNPALVTTAVAKYSKFAEAEPTISATVDAGRNTKSGVIATTPSDNLSSSITVAQNIPRKIKYSSSLTLGGGTSKTSDYAEDTYTDIKRQMTLDNSYRGIGGNLVWNADISRSFDGKDVLAATLKTTASGRVSDAANKMLISGTMPAYTEQTSRDSFADLSVDSKFHWRHRFAKNGRATVAELSFSRVGVNASGEKVDTLPETDVYRWLGYQNREPATKFGADLRYNDVLTSKFTLGVGYRVDGNILKENNRWTDLFSGTLFGPSSRAWDYRQTIHGPYVSFYYKTEHLLVSTGLDARFIHLDMTDFLHGTAPVKRDYFLPSPRFALEGHFPGLNLQLFYSRSFTTPSAVQLSRFIDVSNPYMLSGGNAVLGLASLHRINASVSYIAFPISTTFTLSGRAELNVNPIVNEVKSFSEDTFLEEFGYIATAGAQMTRPVNATGSFGHYEASCMSSTAISSALTFSLSPTLEYSYRPFLAGGAVATNSTATAGLMFYAFSTFSEKIRLILHGSSTFGREMQDMAVLYDFVQWNIFPSVNWNINNSISLTASSALSHFAELDGGRNYSVASLEASLEYHLKKNPEAFFFIKGSNLLDKADSQTTTVLDNYIRYRRSAYLGRAVLVGFSYTFRKY